MLKVWEKRNGGEIKLGYQLAILINSFKFNCSSPSVMVGGDCNYDVILYCQLKGCHSFCRHQHIYLKFK